MASHVLFNNFWGDMCVDNFIYLKSPVFRDTLGKREGSFVYLWPMHVDTQQKATQNYKAIILQLKINKF